MQYKNSINAGRFMLFSFISFIIIIELIGSGKANILMWKSLLPQTEVETISFIVICAIFFTTCNWAFVYFLSLFTKNVLNQTDYVYVILCLIIFFAFIFRIFHSIEINKFNFFIVAAGIFSGYYIYKYWCYFKKRSDVKV